MSTSRDGKKAPSVQLDTSPVESAGVVSLCMPDTPTLGLQQRPLPSPQPQSTPTPAQSRNEEPNASTISPPPTMQQPELHKPQPSQKPSQSTLGGPHPGRSLSNALQPTTGPSNTGGHVLRLRGLPFSATTHQIVEFFGDQHPIIGGIQGVLLTNDAEGRPTGEAFLQMFSEAAQRSALRLHLAQLGSRYIEIFVASLPDMQQAMQKRTSGDRARAQYHDYQLIKPILPPAADSYGGSDDTTVKLRGLPYVASVKDVADWVAGYHVAENGIKLMTKVEHNRERANTGIAFVRFVSADEACRATAQLHRRMMGSRYIECIYPLQRHVAPGQQQPAGPQIAMYAGSPRAVLSSGPPGPLYAVQGLHAMYPVQRGGYGTPGLPGSYGLLAPPQPHAFHQPSPLQPPPPQHQQLQAGGLHQMDPSHGCSYQPRPMGVSRGSASDQLASRLVTSHPQWQPQWQRPQHHHQHAMASWHHHQQQRQMGWGQAMRGTRPGWKQARGSAMGHILPPMLPGRPTMPWFPLASQPPQPPQRSSAFLSGNSGALSPITPPGLPLYRPLRGSSGFGYPPSPGVPYAGTLQGSPLACYPQWQQLQQPPAMWPSGRGNSLPPFSHRNGSPTGPRAHGIGGRPVRHGSIERAHHNHHCLHHQPQSAHERQRRPSEPGVRSAESFHGAVASLESSLQQVTVGTPQQQQPPPLCAGGSQEIQHEGSGHQSSEPPLVVEVSPFATHAFQSQHVSRSSFEGLGATVMPPPYVATISPHRASLDSRLSSSAHALPVDTHAIAQAAAAAAAATEVGRNPRALASRRSSFDGVPVPVDSVQRTFESAPPVQPISLDTTYGAGRPPSGRPSMERSHTAPRIATVDNNNIDSSNTSPINSLLHVSLSETSIVLQARESARIPQ